MTGDGPDSSGGTQNADVEKSGSTVAADEDAVGHETTRRKALLAVAQRLGLLGGNLDALEELQRNPQANPHRNRLSFEARESQ